MLNRFLFAGFFIAMSSIGGIASPIQSKLLPLIPPEAQIVAGIEDPHNPDTRGHMLLVTVNNTFDFDDCQSLTGVDIHRGIDETIWVAASSPHGELNEHLLLVAGRHDREHIFQAAERNGMATGFYRGLEVLLVKPFAREQGQMHDIRWMAILDGQAVVFGTPWLVKKALDRHLNHVPADPLVAERLGRLHPLVNSWDVLVMPHEISSNRAALGQSPAPWIDLLGRELVEAADELTLGVRFGSTARVDFVVRTADSSGTSSAGDGAGQWQIFQPTSSQRMRTRVENLSIDRNLIRGSIVLSGRELNACFKSLSCDRPVGRIQPGK
jgi:hypothetical protein